ncbi:MAG: Kinase A inhibitor [Firmicutes bacterium]|nr:Kinase A inhibitor [candidate division NPL-UPA2 bacterium]
MPRLATPRTKVPAGSVAIAELQAGIYPLESPGGWHLLGRTPLRLYRPDCSPPVLLKPWQSVRFRPVTLGEYTHIQAQVATDEYVPLVTREVET